MLKERKIYIPKNEALKVEIIQLHHNILIARHGRKWKTTKLVTRDVKQYVLWQPLVTMTNSNTNNKSLSRISSGNHKKTQQGVSAKLLPYLYKLHMVHATNN